MNSEISVCSRSNTSERVRIRKTDFKFIVDDADGEHAVPDLNILGGGESCMGESSSFSNPLSSAIELRLLPDHDIGALGWDREKESRLSVIA